MKIPIRNLYFLLAYAWDRLEEADSLKISPNDFDDAANLLARLLISGVQKIIKTGLERCYVEHEAEYRGIKGKLLLTETVKKQLHRKGRTVCAFDEYTKNSVNNRILKSTLIAIKRAPSINKKQRQEASDCLDHFLETEAGLLSSQIFQRARIGRSNVHYKLPLKVSEMIYQHSFVDEKSGDTVFRDFLREEKAMARLYEDFLFNFYKREQRRFSVKRENIEWHTVEESAYQHLLPIMRTDISLQSEDIKLVIDAKYYQKTLTEHFGSRRINSSNLYQIFSYLKNLEMDERNPLNRDCSGMLLYPRVDQDINASYKFGQHEVRIKTIDLYQDWRLISEELLNLLPSSRHALSSTG